MCYSNGVIAMIQYFFRLKSLGLNAPPTRGSWQPDDGSDSSLSASNGAAKPIQMRSLPQNPHAWLQSEWKPTYQYETAYPKLWRESLLAGWNIIRQSGIKTLQNQIWNHSPEQNIAVMGAAFWKEKLIMFEMHLQFLNSDFYQKIFTETNNLSFSSDVLTSLVEIMLFCGLLDQSNRYSL